VSRAPEKRREIAIGLVIDDGGHILLQHRDNKPGLTGANQWGFFGGHLEPGETPTRALLRELDEELGWRPRHFEHYLTTDADRGRDRAHVTSHAFAAHLDVPVAALTLGEGQAMRLFAPDALPPDIVPSTRPVIEEFAQSDVYGRVRRSWKIITTTGLIVDAEGRFLLQLRDDKPEIVNPNKWGSFGGVLEPYETPEEGFLRELDEELSWRPAESSMIRAVHRDEHLVYVFAARLDVPQDTLVLGEGQDFAAFAPDALPDTTVPSLRRLIEWFVMTDEYRAMWR
jgi:mutator protein MutT